MSIGFASRKKFRVAAAIEIDADSSEAFTKNLGVKPITDDVRNVSAQRVLRQARLRKGECTVLIGCAPCQSFSAHRRGRKKNKVDQVRNSLPFAWLSLVKGVLPRHVCFENVPGLVKASRGAIFKKFLNELEGLGYKVAWAIENASDYGVPQSRKRLLVVGSRVANPILPKPTHGDPESDDVAAGKIEPWRTVRDALEHLPELASGEMDEFDPYHAAREQQTIVLRRLRYIGEGQSHVDLPPRLRLDCHREHYGHPDVYGRMWWDAPAPTLTGGCTNLTKGRFAHPAQDRSITLREAMQLQTFPKRTVLAGTREKMQLQVGNAVPPLLASRIAKIILEMEREAGERVGRKAPNKRRSRVARVPKSSKPSNRSGSETAKRPRRVRGSR
jgi:DNA (cytosine-5)-methyltransferase 1